MMRRFVLVRNEDVTGKSGVGIIGEGIEWRGGSAHLHWVTDYESFVHWPGGVDAILAVHGHEGATVVRFLDDVPNLNAPDLWIRDASTLGHHLIASEAFVVPDEDYGRIAPDWEEQLGNARYEDPPLNNDYPDNDAHDPRD